MYINDFKYLSRKRRHMFVNFLIKNIINKIPIPKRITIKVLYIFHKLVTFAPFAIFMQKSRILLIISLIFSSIVICMFVFFNGCWLSSVEKIMSKGNFSNVNDVIFKCLNIAETRKNGYYITYLIMTIGFILAVIRTFWQKKEFFFTIVKYSFIFIFGILFFGICTVM